MNSHLAPHPGDEAPRQHAEPVPAPTGLKISVNGRTVVQRHFLQQAMDAMVRRALADQPAHDSH